jgi:hypothetical protein
MSAAVTAEGGTICSAFGVGQSLTLPMLLRRRRAS